MTTYLFFNIKVYYPTQGGQTFANLDLDVFKTIFDKPTSITGNGSTWTATYGGADLPADGVNISAGTSVTVTGTGSTPNGTVPWPSYDDVKPLLASYGYLIKPLDGSGSVSDHIDLTGFPGGVASTGFMSESTKVPVLDSMVSHGTLITVVETGDGNDSITTNASTGAYGAYVFAGTGDDVVNAHDGDMVHGDGGTDLLVYSTASAVNLSIANEVAATDKPVAVGKLYAAGFEVFDLTTGTADDTLDLTGANLVTRAADDLSDVTKSRFDLDGGQNTVKVDASTKGDANLILSGTDDWLDADFTGNTTGVYVSASKIVTKTLTLDADTTVFEHLKVTGGSGNDTITASFGDEVHGGAGIDLIIFDASVDPSIGATYPDTSQVGWLMADGFEVFDIKTGSTDDVLDLRGKDFVTRESDANSSLTTSHFALGGGTNTVKVDASTQGIVHVDLSGDNDQLEADFSGYGSSVTVTASQITSPNLSVDAGSTTFERMIVTGGMSDDHLTGSLGDDTLRGGAGNDELVGGAGADRFVFNTGDGADRVDDFNAGEGDKIDLTETAYKSFADLAGKITQSGSDTVIDLGGAGDTITLAATTASSLAADQFVFCFYPDTLITTALGKVPVQELRPGDLVACADGCARPVRWVGTQSVTTRCRHPERILPIRIKAGALADAVPSRDLLVSPDHALVIDGNLVAALALVNGHSILRETQVPERFTYYHVEFDDHAVLFAEDAPAESFVDNVDRLHFDNWSEHLALCEGRPPMAELPYPRAKSHRQVPRETRRRLAAQAAKIWIERDLAAGATAAA